MLRIVYFKLLIALSFVLMFNGLSAQNVGIGTNNPQEKLHVSEFIRSDSLAHPDSSLVGADQNGTLFKIPFTGDTSDILRGDGTWGAAPSSGTGGGGMFDTIIVYQSSGSYTWTVPSGVDKIMVEVWGAGGGGGAGNGCGANTDNGAGGCGGGYGKSYFNVTTGQTFTVTVGSGGSGGSCSCGVGTAGGNSSFGALLQATGGDGGEGCGDNFANSGGTSNGQLSMQGQKGEPHNGTFDTPDGGLAGDGSTFGKGGDGDTWGGSPGKDGAVAIYY